MLVGIYVTYKFPIPFKDAENVQCSVTSVGP